MSKNTDKQEGSVEASEINYDFRGLGLGEVNGATDRLKMLSTAIHEISQVRGNWEGQDTMNDIFANMNMLLVYCHQSMRNDFNEKGELEPIMNSELTKFGESEVNLATMILNILDMAAERNLRLPETMMAVYNYRLKLLKEDLLEMKKTE